MELPAACEARPFDPNATLGPLGIDYLHVHYCLLAGLPLLSAAALLAWLALLFYFRAWLQAVIYMKKRTVAVATAGANDSLGGLRSRQHGRRLLLAHARQHQRQGAALALSTIVLPD